VKGLWQKVDRDVGEDLSEFARKAARQRVQAVQTRRGFCTARENRDEPFWKLPLTAYASRIVEMSETDQSLFDNELRQDRLDLAGRAFREFYAQCFWSYREDAEFSQIL
jgi:hypothetical protein